jgi:hypothetical protein
MVCLLIDSYWALDNGLYELGVDLLCSSPSEKQFHTIILATLLKSTNYSHALRFMDICCPPASSRDVEVVQMHVVIESSGLHDGILYARDRDLFGALLEYCFANSGMFYVLTNHSHDTRVDFVPLY